jgi:tetratricopeptide (TPR) repeat protein
MRQILSFLIVTIMTTTNIASAQNLNFKKVKEYEHQLDDVMELIDTNLVKEKLKETENDFRAEKTEINKLRLGIIYHETALNLSFLSSSSFRGYAQKSFEVLDTLFVSENTTKELMPFIASYRASALALVSAETKKLNLLSMAFNDFEDAVKKYAEISYSPEFMRGSVAENLPWFFFKKRKYAKQDFESIISKYEKNKDYANWKIMSFTYWTWANHHQSKKNRVQALKYLDKAIALDPDYKAGRKRAEDLKTKLLK